MDRDTYLAAVSTLNDSLALVRRLGQQEARHRGAQPRIRVFTQDRAAKAAERAEQDRAIAAQRAIEDALDDAKEAALELSGLRVAVTGQVTRATERYVPGMAGLIGGGHYTTDRTTTDVTDETGILDVHVNTGVMFGPSATWALLPADGRKRHALDATTSFDPTKVVIDLLD